MVFDLILERFCRVKGWMVVPCSEMEFGAEEFEWSLSQPHGDVSFLCQRPSWK